MSEHPDRRLKARELRRSGRSLREIAEAVSASKSTVSGWCQDIHLTTIQSEILAQNARQANRRSRNTQWKRHEEVNRIERDSELAIPMLISNPLWTTGLALYWGEGAKTQRSLRLANADTEILRLFIDWTTEFHGLSEFTCGIHLHAENDETAARTFWARNLGIRPDQFDKTVIKHSGAGNRKNHLAHGVARLYVLKSADAWIRTMTWIRCLPSHL